MDDTDLSRHGVDSRHEHGAPTAARPQRQATCWACGETAHPDREYDELALQRCDACGLLFAPWRGDDELQELYDAGYFERYPCGESYDADERQRRYENSRRVRFMRRHVPAGRMLEIGSASGYFLEAARDAGFDAQGIEPVRSYADRASERFGLPVTAGFIEQIELEPNSFDVVCAWHVVEHLNDPRAVLGRIRAALKPGGTLLLEVPNISSIKSVRRKAGWEHLDAERHVGHYQPSSARALLARAGYEIAAVDTISGYAYHRPSQALRPKTVAGQVKEALVERASPHRPHAWKHELMRIVARRP
ncbi:MAG: methyltransferase domain-containing protein [Solirubrobacteraceae bacterium]